MNNKTMKKWFSMFALFLLAGFSSASAQQLVIDDVQSYLKENYVSSSL